MVLKSDSKQQILEHARQSLVEQGVRWTKKRRDVFALLLHQDQPLSAYDVAAHYRDRHGSEIPAMSVYRMLEVLQQAGLVHKLKSAGRYIACRHIVCEHDHGRPQFLICDRCHEVKELALESLTLAMHREADNIGFEVTDPHLEIHGLCCQCRPQVASKP